MSIGPEQDSDRFAAPDEPAAPFGRSHNGRPFTHEDNPVWYVHHSSPLWPHPVPPVFRYPLTSLLITGSILVVGMVALLGWKLVALAFGVVCGSLFALGLWEWFRGKR